jgi:hypothetical protein
LQKTLTAVGVADILDYDFISFGNAYYLQPECPGYPNYDRADGVACWQAKCSVDNAPAECFTGTIACQHGDDECHGNNIETCAKSLYPDFPVYSAFNFCLEASFPATDTTVSSCAKTAGMDAAAINACVADDDQLQALNAAEAQKTAKAMIPGTPTVILNGEAVAQTNLLLRNVCTAFKTLNPSVAAPAGCPSSDVTANLRGSSASAALLM